jgi:hypothetical protein
MSYPYPTPTVPFPAAAEVADLTQRVAGAQVAALTAGLAVAVSWWTAALTAPFTAAEHAGRLIQPEALKPDSYRHSPEG